MAEKFYVRLTIFFLDGSVSESITDIWDAVALDRALKDGFGLGFVGSHALILRDLPFTVTGKEFETSLTVVLLHQAI